MTNAGKTRLVGIIIKRMERIVAKGGTISSDGIALDYSGKKVKYDFERKGMASGICAVSAMALGANLVDDAYGYMDCALENFPEVGDYTLCSIERGFFKSGNILYCEVDKLYYKSGLDIGRRVRSIAIKRGWMIDE